MYHYVEIDSIEPLRWAVEECGFRRVICYPTCTHYFSTRKSRDDDYPKYEPSFMILSIRPSQDYCTAATVSHVNIIMVARSALDDDNLV